MSWSITADLGRFDDAVSHFRSRTTLTDPEYEALSDEARQKSFYYAGGVELEAVQTVFSEVDRAIEQGTTFEAFKERVREKLGTLGPKGAHLETVFRNAVQTSYNAGRWNQMKAADVRRFRPYWMFDSILDGRTTEVCKLCNGVVKLHDDPWWNARVPPLHHRCRSSIRNLRASEAFKRGITEDDPAAGVPAQGSFGKPPTLASNRDLSPDPSRIDPAAWAEFERKQRVYEGEFIAERIERANDNDDE